MAKMPALLVNLAHQKTSKTPPRTGRGRGSLRGLLFDSRGSHGDPLSDSRGSLRDPSFDSRGSLRDPSLVRRALRDNDRSLDSLNRSSQEGDRCFVGVDSPGRQTGSGNCATGPLETWIQVGIA